jgi:hypothetical protein
VSKRGDDATAVELVPLDQFKAFVRRVVSVPKTAIDEELQRSQQRRKRATKRRRQG